MTIKAKINALVAFLIKSNGKVSVDKVFAILAFICEMVFIYNLEQAIGLTGILTRFL